ncbi:MAG: cytochrome c [Proteobacteria bacterium]|nr:cytochrome c [Pseudomonadota bacterium]
MPGANGPAKALSRARRALALGIALAGLIGLVLTGLVVTGPGAASGAERGADAEALARGAAVARGAYVFRAAGCTGCHTDPKRKHEPLAGGPALETPFGTFYGPNISPDPEHGIGRWSDADFLRALREGLAPDGRHYYPVFPYPSYSGMTERDALDLKAYIFSLAPVARPNRPHEVSFPFEFRFLLGAWKALYFAPRRFAPDPARDAQWNRGAYLVEHLGHCGECHTPRDFLGAKDEDRKLAGNPKGPDGKKVPNITPDPEDGIGRWRAGDLTYYLKTGFRPPDGDVAGGAMSGVIEDATAHLSDADRAAIAAYLSSLSPIPRQ